MACADTGPTGPARANRSEAKPAPARGGAGAGARVPVGEPAIGGIQGRILPKLPPDGSVSLLDFRPVPAFQPSEEAAGAARCPSIRPSANRSTTILIPTE